MKAVQRFAQRLVSSPAAAVVVLVAVAVVLGSFLASVLKPCGRGAGWDGFRVPGFQGPGFRRPGARERPLRVRVEIVVGTGDGKPRSLARRVVKFVTVNNEQHARQILRTNERAGIAGFENDVAAVYWFQVNKGYDYIVNDKEINRRNNWERKLLESAFNSVYDGYRGWSFRVCADPGSGKSCCHTQHYSNKLDATWRTDLMCPGNMRTRAPSAKFPASVMNSGWRPQPRVTPKP